MCRLRPAAVAGVLLTAALVAPGWGQPGDDAGEPAPTAEQELRQHAEALLEQTVCSRCRGLGLLLKREGYFRQVVLADPWCARPDRMCVEPLAQLMVEEDAREFPEAHLCPECCGLGFRFTPRILRLYGGLRKEMHLHEEDLSAEAREELRRQVYLFNLARGYFRIIEEITRPHLPYEEPEVRRQIYCANFYEYRLVLAEVFANLVRCFPPGEPTLERDRQAHERASQWKPRGKPLRLIEQFGGVRIPGSNLSFAEWAGLPRPRWDLLEAVHRQEMEHGAGAYLDPDLEQAVLERARALFERSVCSHCGGSRITSIVLRPAAAPRKLRSGLSREIDFRKPHKRPVVTLRSRRVPCARCGGLGWQTAEPLDVWYQVFSDRLEQARPYISPSVYEEAWLLGRQFQLEVFLHDRMLAAQAAGKKGASLRLASQVAHFRRAGRILIHSFNFRARGPEADWLAQYRKTQFDRHGQVDRICRALDPAVVPGSWLTLGEWAAGQWTRSVREEEATEPATSTPKDEPPAPVPEVPLHPLDQLEE